MFRRGRRGDDGHDGVAWPGLVDLFAFAMVITLLLWAQSVQSDPPLPPAAPSDPAPVVEQRLREIERILRKELQTRVEDVRYEPDPQRVEVRTRIRFATQDYRLDESQRADVSTVVRILLGTLRNEPDTLLAISGKADPRQFEGANPPRDNVELSALRAAEVSRLVFGTSLDVTGVRERVSVRGLGDSGAAVRNAPNADMVRMRTVTFEIHVDQSKLIAPPIAAPARSQNLVTR